jgi:hypothetical protein
MTPGEGEASGYREGRVDAELQEVNRRLDHITKKLDQSLEWQQKTEARLAEGAVRFLTLTNNQVAHAAALDEFRDSQRGVLAIASTIGAALGAALATAMRILGIPGGNQ